MNSNFRNGLTLLVGSLFLASALALPAAAQQAGSDKAPQGGAARQNGPGDGTGNQGVGPKDGTGYGSPAKASGSSIQGLSGFGPGNGTGNSGVGPKDGTGYGASSGKGSGSGTCTGSGPSGSSSRSGRRGGRG